MARSDRQGIQVAAGRLVEAAHAAARTQNSYLAAQYARLRGRRGPKKAALAVAHSILVIAWHLLSHGEPDTDLGPTTSSSARPIRPTGTAWSDNSSAWATRSPWNQQQPDRPLCSGRLAAQGIFT